MNSDKLVIMYRSLQVLDGIHNACCADFLWPLTQNMYMYLHVLINVVLIKYNSKISSSYLIMLILASMILTAFEKICFQSAADLHEFSKELREKTMNCRRKSRLIGRSFRCLRAQVGSFYFLQTSTFTTYMQSLVDQTINIILTFLSWNHLKYDWTALCLFMFRTPDLSELRKSRFANEPQFGPFITILKIWIGPTFFALI